MKLAYLKIAKLQNPLLSVMLSGYTVSTPLTFGNGITGGMSNDAST